MKKIRLGVLGAGGLGKACLDICKKKEDVVVTAICDSNGYLYSEKGISKSDLNKMRPSKDSIGEIIKLKNKIDGIFIALPNLPNEFIPSVVKRFVQAGYKGVFTDAVKRTRAVKLRSEERRVGKECRSRGSPDH